MDDVNIPLVDQQRINDMVNQYRHQITNLYHMGYLMGSIEQVEKDRARLKGELAAMESV